MPNELLIRPRLNALLAQAVKKPLTIVCAGMGCGKTRAVYDFTQECKIPVAWMQIIDADNIGPRLWEWFLHAVAKTNRRLAGEYKKLGFPDTEDKLQLYVKIQNSMTNGVPCMFVFDDFHLLKDTAVLKFMERGFNNLPENASIILITRDLPKINLTSLSVRDKVCLINETELNFTESEISQFLASQGLNTEIGSLKTINSDTNGWALLVNFVMRMLKKSPGYMGYVSDILKKDVAQLIEAEIWEGISERLRRFLLRLSLINHHSASLVNILGGGDENLLAELRAQNAFIRFNNHIASWHIHPALLDFLRSMQNLLTEGEMCETYKAAADWCIKNNFVVDALFYCEKTKDYETIVSILLMREPKFLTDNAGLLYGIFARAPEDIFDRLEFSAALYIQAAYFVLNREKALELTEYYEKKYLMVPEGAFKNLMLGAVYYCRGYLSLLLSLFDDRYDFDGYFARQYEYSKGLSIAPKCWYQHPVGMWTSMVGVSRAGAPQEYIDAVSRSSRYLQQCAGGLTAGIDELCRGELLFYQGSIEKAKIHMNEALKKATEHRQLTIIHRAMFYTMRIAVFLGDYAAAEHMQKKMEEQLVNDDCLGCVIDCEISIAWFYCILRRPELILHWLKEKFAPYVHPNSLENFGNQIKARYFYLTDNYAPLLSFIGEMKKRESIIFERVEMLALEACIHSKMDDRPAALGALREAYEAASPNGIIMPFVELGKDMRSLAIAAAGDPGCTIPPAWLQSIKQAASAYSRNQASIISDYTRKNQAFVRIALSPQEKVILQDMYAGLSNPEIAARLNLSINTVKMHVGGIYNKFGARNKADIFRIAAENDLLSGK